MADKSSTPTPEKVLTIPCSLNEDFFKNYLRFMKPIHRLTEGQMTILASFLYQRYELSKSISSPEILDQFTLSSDVRKKIREKYDISPTHFQVIMSKFKEYGIIANGRILPKLIPNIPDDPKLFKLSIYFKFDEQE